LDHVSPAAVHVHDLQHPDDRGPGLSTLAFTILVLSALARFKPVSDVAQPTIFTISAN
jgi:hypothetical protein